MTKGSCIFIIVDRGKANELLRRAQRFGIRQGTILLGEGTKPSRIADFLGISKTQKEVLMLAVSPEGSEQVYTLLREAFKMHRRYRGIAFSVPYRPYEPGRAGASVFSRQLGAPHVCLMTVLDRGLGKECMDVARAAGAQGGTVLHAHGAGVPRDFFFPLMVEPQKDIVLIVTPSSAAAAISEAIFTGMRLERRGSGILFALPVLKTLGLYEGRRPWGEVGP